MLYIWIRHKSNLRQLEKRNHNACILNVYAVVLSLSLLALRCVVVTATATEGASTEPETWPGPLVSRPIGWIRELHLSIDRHPHPIQCVSPSLRRWSSAILRSIRLVRSPEGGDQSLPYGLAASVPKFWQSLDSPLPHPGVKPFSSGLDDCHEGNSFGPNQPKYGGAAQYPVSKSPQQVAA